VSGYRSHIIITTPSYVRDGMPFLQTRHYYIILIRTYYNLMSHSMTII